jgi:hypothetical protein
MIRLVPLLLLAFKIWMVVDAVRKSQPYYWFLIIFFLPFGDVVYFFMVKIHDLRGPKLAAFFHPQPSIAELQSRYRNARSIENRLALARALADAGRHVEAIVELEGVCADRPDEPDALWGLGTSHAALKELPQASDALTRLIAVAPSYNDWEAWVVLAGVQRDLGLHAESLQTLRMLVRKCPRADHQMFLIDALLAAGRQEEATEALDRILEDDRNGPDYIRRSSRKIVARARRLREELQRARPPA